MASARTGDAHAAARPERRQDARTWLRRAAASALVACALGYIPYHLYVRSGLARTLALRRDLAALRARNAEVRAENERLSRDARALRSDLRAIERVVRRELGWVRPGDVVFEIRAPARGGTDAP